MLNFVFLQKKLLLLMNIEEVRTYCLRKNGVEESFPFDNETLVFKVGGKMFLLTSLVSPEFRINLKTAPEKSLLLREEYPQITPGFHMNKKHWNTVLIDGKLSEKLIYGLIDESYDLVFNSLSKKKQRELLS